MIAGRSRRQGGTINIGLYKLAYWGYGATRKVLTAAGLSGLLRAKIGPLAGRVLSRVAVDSSRPSLVRGHQMFLAAPGTYAPIAMAMDRYEEGTTKLFESLLRPGMVVMDVGAHVGYFSLLAARLVGTQGRIYAFEPEPENHELLLKNIELNGYTNIMAVKTAVSNRVGPSNLFLTALDNGRHSIYHHGLPERASIMVETTTIDAFLETKDWPKIDLVKVDAEGAETDVLKGMSQLLENSQGVQLILEFNPSALRSAGDDPIQLLEQLADRGFEVKGIFEKQGPLPLQEVERVPLVNRLLKNASSINLFCSR